MVVVMRATRVAYGLGRTVSTSVRGDYDAEYLMLLADRLVVFPDVVGEAWAVPGAKRARVALARVPRLPGGRLPGKTPG